MKHVVIPIALGALCLLAACPKKSGHTPVATSPQQQQAQQQAQQNVGFPIPLTLPPDAVTPQDVDLIPGAMAGPMTTWSAPFSYSGGFEKVVQSFDAQLKQQKFSRIGGPKQEIDPGFKIEDSIKPLNGEGKRVWISADRRIIVFLIYNYHREAKADKSEQHMYQLNIVKADDPQPVNPPSVVKPIP